MGKLIIELQVNEDEIARISIPRLEKALKVFKGVRVFSIDAYCNYPAYLDVHSPESFAKTYFPKKKTKAKKRKS